MRRVVTAALTVALVVTGTVAARATGSLPDGAPEAPLLHAETAAGKGIVGKAAPVAPTAKVVDGNIADWTGTDPGFAGAVVRSHGELIYADHLFDAYGADDGADAQRLGVLGPIIKAVPETYRTEAVMQADVPGELGAPNPLPEALNATENYGDAGFQPAADLLEFRTAADASNLYVLARTTTMTTPDQTAVLVLLDTGRAHAASAKTLPVPFNSGIHTDRADMAVFLAHTGSRAVDLLTGAVTPVTAAVNASGWDNAIEAAIPRALLESSPGNSAGHGNAYGHDKLAIAAATGLFDPAAGAFKDLKAANGTDIANLANVAFRAEPVRTWFDELQALDLGAGTIDPFFTSVDVKSLVDGTTETWRPGPGYHERIFQSEARISSEGGSEGIWQPYGVEVPPHFDPAKQTPATFWMHWRGGKAHSAAALSPRIMRDQGDNRGGLVFAPRGRGSSTWYLGVGMVDFLEVWKDAMQTFPVDQNRVYVSGHSMGGWASFLLPILMPDRFAGAFPVSPPVTQGAWTGLDFQGCDNYTYQEYSFCYVQTNDGNARVEHTRRLLDNLRNVPIAIYAGGIDELVPVSGETLQAERLAELGYQYRYYVFPTYEHYTFPVVDEWADAVRYLDQFKRNPNPAHVTYIRDMPFEHAVQQGPSLHDHPTQGLADILQFKSAYWMSELTPVDAAKGVAHFDGRSLAIADPATLTVPEAGAGSSLGQVGPFTMSGLRWLPDPTAAAPTRTNGFDVTLTGARTVRLDLARMAVSTASAVHGTVTTDTAGFVLQLAGAWAAAPAVTVNGHAVIATLADGVLSITLPPGPSTLVIG